MIPDFDHNHVIPPHIGDPRRLSDLSPYLCNTLELCERFATSKERIEILKNFLVFRKKITEVGITGGFQWLDGSFTEDVEKRETRPPNDLDLVTFYGGLSESTLKAIVINFKEFRSPQLSKLNYKLDHYGVDYMFSPDVTVEQVRYWLQLFSHNRLEVWKGILKVELNTPEIDAKALEFLESKT